MTSRAGIPDDVEPRYESGQEQMARQDKERLERVKDRLVRAYENRVGDVVVYSSEVYPVMKALEEACQE